MANGERTRRKASSKDSRSAGNPPAGPDEKSASSRPSKDSRSAGDPPAGHVEKSASSRNKEPPATTTTSRTPPQAAAEAALLKEPVAAPKKPAAKEAAKAPLNALAAKEAAKEPVAKEAAKATPKEPAAKEAAKTIAKEDQLRIHTAMAELLGEKMLAQLQEHVAELQAHVPPVWKENAQRLHAELPQVVRDAEPWQQAAGAGSVFLVLVLLLKSLFCRKQRRQMPERQRSWSEAEEEDVNAFFRRLGARDEPHEEGVVLTPNGNRLIHGNALEASDYENDVLYGKVLAMHQLTFDKKKYPNAETKYEPYFKSRKRSWEVRVQFRFKKPVNIQDVFFGIECDQYVPLNLVQTAAMKGLVRMMKVPLPKLPDGGDSIYHSCGDNPDKVKADELEKPVFVMPMYAFDGFIVTPEDEIPPRLEDAEDVLNRCKLRSGRVNAFVKEILNTELKPGPVYTFCFWGISQWLDKLNWKLRGMGVGGKNMNEFCGKPPVHLVIYTMPSESGNRTGVKHLGSKRESLLHMPFWCSHFRPGYLDSPAETKRLVQGYLRNPLGAGPLSTRGRNGKQHHKDKESTWCCLIR